MDRGTPTAARPGRNGHPTRYRNCGRGFKPDYLSFAGTYQCNRTGVHSNAAAVVIQRHRAADRLVGLVVRSELGVELA